MSIAMREKITFVTLDQWLWYESYVQEFEFEPHHGYLL